MDFIRDDGRIYEVSHKDTQQRLVESSMFRRVSETNVSDLRKYASDLGITSYSSLKRDELIKALKEGG